MEMLIIKWSSGGKNIQSRSLFVMMILILAIPVSSQVFLEDRTKDPNRTSTLTTHQACQLESLETATRSFNSSEWADRSITIDGDTSDWIGYYTANQIGVGSENVDLYIANNNTHLFICLDAISDNTDEDSVDDNVLILFDGNNDNDVRERTGSPYSPQDINENNDNWITVCGNPSATSSEGTKPIHCHNDAGYILKDPGTEDILLIHDNFNWIDSPGYDWEVEHSGNPAHMVYEMSIPLSQWAWSAGNVTGSVFAVFEHGKDDPIGLWPQGEWEDLYDDVGAWGQLDLGTLNERPKSTGAAATPTSIANSGNDYVLLTVETSDNDGSVAGVNINLTNIHRGSSVAMSDDGTGADETRGDNIYSYRTTVPSSVLSGKYDLPFVIHDDHLPNIGKGYGEIELTVVQTNRKPHFESVNDTDISDLSSISLTAYEDITNIFEFSASDEDRDLLIYSINIGEIFLDLVEGADYLMDTSTGILEFTPKQENVGDHILNIEVNDGNGGSDTLDINLHIENTNDAPFIEKITEREVKQDDWLNITPSATDEDEEYAIRYSTNFTEILEDQDLTDKFSFSEDTGEFRFKPDKHMVRVFYTYIQATDSLGAVFRRNFTINVINVNDPPQPALFDHIVEENDPKVRFLANESSDPDNDIITYKWCFGDGSENKSGEDLRAVEHSYHVEGTYRVKLTISDGVGGSDNISREITVTLPELKGKVRDLQENGIPDVTVVVMKANEDKELINITTDQAGQYDLTLFTGNYNITFSKTGYESVMMRVNIVPGIDQKNINLTALPVKKEERTPTPDSSNSNVWVFCLLALGAMMFVSAFGIMLYMRRKKKSDEAHPMPGLPESVWMASKAPHGRTHHREPARSPQPPPPLHNPYPATPPPSLEREYARIESNEQGEDVPDAVISVKKERKKPVIVSEVKKKKTDETSEEAVIREIFRDTGPVTVLRPRSKRVKQEEEAQDEEEPILKEGKHDESGDSLRKMAVLLRSFSKKNK